MNKILLTTLISIIGLLQVQSQDGYKNSDEHSSFKRNLIEEVNRCLYNSSNAINTLDRQNLKSEIRDYGNDPSWNWTAQFGGSGNDYARDIVSDASGNVYITGSFSGEITLGSNSYTSIGNRDAILVKFDGSGNVVWLRQFSASVYNRIDSYGLCLDESSNIYITGYYTGIVTLGSITLPDNADYNLFFARLNNSGEVVMAKNHGSLGDTEIGLKIDTDISGNIYLVGSASDITYYRHPTIILKYNQTGNMIWEQNHDESFNDMVVFNSNIYFGAYIDDSNDGFIGNSIILEPKGYGDAFIAKSNLNGDFIWASMGDHSTMYHGDSYGTDLTIDEYENIYMSGSFRYEVIFGSDIIIENSGYGGFIVKCSSNGSFLWARNKDYYVEDISTDASNNSYILSRDDYTENLGHISKYNSLGDEQWTTQLDNIFTALDINTSGNIFTSGTIDGLIFLTKMDNNANEAWQVKLNGDSGFGHVIGMVSDNSGNLYTYAYASVEMDYFGDTIQRGSFISKQNGSGEIVWIKQFIDVYQNYGYGSYIALDPSNENVFVTGELTDVLVIPGGPTFYPHIDGSYFIIKYGIDGIFKFAVNEDFNTDYWGGLCLSADYTGNILISGTFGNTINIGGTELTSAGSADAFIAKYNPNGGFLWAMRAGGEDIEYSGLVSVDAIDNIYFTGEFYSVNVTVGNSGITLNQGDGNIIIAAINPNGNVLWVKSKAGSVTSSGWGDDYSWPTGIKTDAQGYSYIKGWHGDSTYFDNFMLDSPYSNMSKFIAKINPDGNVLWVNSIAEHHYGIDYNQMDIDINGNVYIGAQIRDTIHFGDDFDYFNVGENDLFVAKYSTFGELDWVKIMESNTGTNWLSSVAVYDTTNVFVGGCFYNYISFGQSEKYSNNIHGFIAMIGEDISGFEEVYNRMDYIIIIYPNPFTDKTTIKFNNPNHLKYKLSVFSIAGNKVFERGHITTDKFEFEKGDLKPGVYLIELNGEKFFRGKIVIE